MNNNLDKLFNKKLLMIGAITIVLLVAFNWARTHTVINIQVLSDTSGDGISYKIINQSNGEETHVNTTEKSLNKIMPRANYEVSVTSSNTGYVALITSEPFLKTTQVQAKLENEKNRIFVGDEPEACMYYKDVLYSYACAEDINTAKAHIPASTGQPTYAVNTDAEGEIIEGVMEINGSPHLLVNSIGGEEAPHSLKKMDNEFLLENSVEVKGLEAGVPYQVKRYDGGYIAYDLDFTELKKFKDANSNPQTIEITKPESEAHEPASFSTAGKLAGMLFNDVDHEGNVEDTDLPNRSNKLLEGVSELMIYDGTSVRNYVLDNLYTGGGVCGEDKACLLSGDVLQIFDISDDEATPIHKMKGVRDVRFINDKIVATTSQGLVALDPESLTGYYIYSFGDYTFCGIGEAADGYLVCVADKNGSSSALLLSPDSSIDFDIDKSLLELRELPHVSDVSVYKNYIHIVPEAGELIYRQDVQGYGYDPEELRNANKNIDDAIDELGIDRNKYTIINPYK